MDFTLYDNNIRILVYTAYNSLNQSFVLYIFFKKITIIIIVIKMDIGRLYYCIFPVFRTSLW
jgi:hypothetical protein